MTERSAPITPDDLVRLAPDYLQRQRWYGAAGRTLVGVETVDFEVLQPGLPALVWALVDGHFAEGDAVTYQLVLGVRPLEDTERFLEGKGRMFLGDLDTPDGPVLVYDALVDPDLAVLFLRHIAPDEEVERMRPINVEQSNTSVIFDERLILKVFRRVPVGPNPDVEMTDALARAGFTHISAPVAAWRRDGRDLAVVRQYLAGGSDGWQLAMTSLRDLYDRRLDPALSGGDFAPEASRLGEITADMHLALARGLGSQPGDAGEWAAAMVAQLDRVPPGTIDGEAVAAVYARLRDVDDAGCAIRVHGDAHLGQTMRTDDGWYVLDFEGEPAAPLDERRQPSSPLRDVAGMLRSFHYAAQAGLIERGVELDDELADLADQWERRSADAFFKGYLAVDGIESLLPPDEGDRRLVLDAFLLAKAVYEVAYEAAHRPDWLPIPLSAVRRLLDQGVGA
jgi:maltokinase